MSWLFSQALVAEYSAATCSDGEQSAQLNVMPTPHKFWRNDKTMDASQHSRFGLTCAVLTESRGEELLTLFLAAFPARTSVSQAAEMDSMVSDQGFGASLRGWFATFDRDSSSWKTAQRSLLGDSESFSETWPRWGSMRNGVSYPLPMPELRICVSESGLRLPTPCAIDTGSRVNKSASAGAAVRPTLGAMARHALWPTPTVCGNYNRPGASANSGMGLATAVKLWPTPTASLGTKGGRITPRKSREGGTLIEAVSARTWATATARDWRSGKASQATHDRNSRPLSEQVGGLLNPDWVEWLMGWPIGWTALKPLAMDKFQEWRRQHSIFSEQ